MNPDKKITLSISDFMKFLISKQNSGTDKLPPLTELSKDLGISIASLREQLEVARALELVEVKPKLGIRRLPYSFEPAVYKSVGYAITCDPSLFQQFADLRNKIEAAYWYEAVEKLNEDDRDNILFLVDQAFKKLKGDPVQIPHFEHRKLHLTIYSRLNNPFVTGILEAYWELYEDSGLDVYTELDYLQKVWQYHQKIVNSIIQEDYSTGYQALIEHKGLLFQRKKPLSRQRFE